MRLDIFFYFKIISSFVSFVASYEQCRLVRIKNSFICHSKILPFIHCELLTKKLNSCKEFVLNGTIPHLYSVGYFEQNTFDVTTLRTLPLNCSLLTFTCWLNMVIYLRKHDLQESRMSPHFIQVTDKICKCIPKTSAQKILNSD